MQFEKLLLPAHNKNSFGLLRAQVNGNATISNHKTKEFHPMTSIISALNYKW